MALFVVYIPAIVSGLALGIAFPTWHLFPLAWVALIPLFARTYDATVRDGFCHFFLAGCVFYLILLQWLMTNVYWAGGWAFWGYIALTLFMALYWGVIGALWAWTRPRLRWFPAALLIAVLWAVMEFLQGILLTGFGWGALAYSQGPDLRLLQWAALGGAGTISMLLVAFNALIAQVIVAPKQRVLHLVSAAVVLAAPHLVGQFLMHEADYGPDPFSVGLLQADFPLEMKWDPEYTMEMVNNASEKSRLLASQTDVDLFVWPESLITDDIHRPDIEPIVTSLTAETGVPLFAGAMRQEEITGNDRNSGYFVDGTGRIDGHYDKVHLAPFGEYVPLARYFPFIGKVVPAIGNVEPGETLKVFATDRRRIGPLICFEVLFPGMSEALRTEGADMLVVITNLGWFGASNAIPQELEVARLRAIETRLPLVHCANTGISGVFDPWGRFEPLVKGYPPSATIMGRFVGALPVAKAAERPIVFGPRLFPWIVLLTAGLALGLAIFSRKPVKRLGGYD